MFKSYIIMTHQPTFDERIEELQSSINILRDILEYRRFSGGDTASLIDDIAELKKDIADVENERRRYLQNTI